MKRRAFSLIELLIVVGIIAAFVGVMVPFFQENLAEASKLARKNGSTVQEILNPEPQPFQYRFMAEKGDVVRAEERLKRIELKIDKLLQIEETKSKRSEHEPIVTTLERRIELPREDIEKAR